VRETETQRSTQKQKKQSDLKSGRPRGREGRDSRERKVGEKEKVFSAAMPAQGWAEFCFPNPPDHAHGNIQKHESRVHFFFSLCRSVLHVKKLMSWLLLLRRLPSRAPICDVMFTGKKEIVVYYCVLYNWIWRQFSHVTRELSFASTELQRDSNEIQDGQGALLTFSQVVDCNIVVSVNFSH
jgi:hypothetical protein